jgi:magnesium chelatase accessory protein
MTAWPGDGEPRLAGRLDPSEMFPAGSPRIHARVVTLSSGLRLRVAECGRADAPAVLLLHGWGASIYMWRDWFEPLAISGRRAIAVDLPGHGLSDKPSDPRAYRLGALTSAVRELLDLEGLMQPDMVAQSMAGAVALELAFSGRVRRLALINPALFGRIGTLRLARRMSPAVPDRIVDRVLPRLVSRWLVARTHRLVYGDPSRISRRDEMEYWAPSQFPAYARAMRLLVHEFDWARPPAEELARRLNTLAEPLLVILGTCDRLVRDAAPYVAALRAASARLELHMIVGGGHAVNEERPAEVETLVESFLGR